MDSYLLAWNPLRSGWNDIDALIAEVAGPDPAIAHWSTGNRRNLPKGSRVFLIRLGLEPKGIVGWGETLSEPTLGPHWDPDRADKKTRYCKVRFDSLSKEPLIRWDELTNAPFSSFNWSIQSSGIQIPEPVYDCDILSHVSSILG